MIHLIKRGIEQDHQRITDNFIDCSFMLDHNGTHLIQILIENLYQFFWIQFFRQRCKSSNI